MSDEDYYEDDFDTSSAAPTAPASASASASGSASTAQQTTDTSFNNNSLNTSFPPSLVSQSHQSKDVAAVSVPSSGPEASQSAASAPAAPLAPPPLPPSASAPLDVSFLSNPRATAEYQIAWELELWRREQQSQFLAELKRKEEAKLKQLVDEFKRQELLREQQWSQRSKGVSALEKKLSSALFEVQQHEKQLKLREAELEAKFTHINTEIGRKYEEAELAVKRVKEQLAHSQSMAKRVEKDLEAQISGLKTANHNLELQLKESDAQFLQYKQKVARSTVGELRLQLAEKDLAIKQWEERGAEMSRAKSVADERVQHCLKEIARLNGLVEEKEKEKLSAERKEIQRMRMVYLAKQSSQGLRRDKEELESIRKELERFKARPDGADNGGANSLPIPQFSLFNLHDEAEPMAEEKQQSLNQQ